MLKETRVLDSMIGSCMRYLDHAATSYPKPPAVLEAMAEAIQQIGNPGRAGHGLSLAAGTIVSQTRRELAGLIGARDPRQIVLAFNGTDALNIAIKGLIQPGDHVISGVLEHNSVLRPLSGLAASGVETTFLDCDDSGYYDSQSLDAAVRPNTRLVALSLASNVLGTVQPVEEIGAWCRQRGIPFLVDAAQGLGTIHVDVKSMNIDLLAAPGHKGLLGPTGTGFLYVASGIDLRPFREGGTGSQSEDPRQPQQMPERLEAGTANVLGMAGLLAGIERVSREDMSASELNLSQSLALGLEAISGIRLLIPVGERKRIGIVSFVADWCPPDELATILDQSFGIAVRAGLHCAPKAHERVGTLPGGAVRVSFGWNSTQADVDALLTALAQIQSEMA